jgi:membrane protein YdbS with pleckstrin-like domain
MGWALVGICPDLAARISWHNQFIGDLWGVRCGVLIAQNQLVPILVCQT